METTLYLDLLFDFNQLNALQELEEAINTARQNCGRNSKEADHANRQYQDKMDEFVLDNMDFAIFKNYENHKFEINPKYASHLQRWCWLRDFDYKISESIDSQHQIIEIFEKEKFM